MEHTFSPLTIAPHSPPAGNVHLRTSLPDSNAETRTSLYNGDLFLLPATPHSQALVEDVRRAMGDLLKTDDLRRAQFSMTSDELFAKMGLLRKKFYTEPIFLEHTWNILQERGFVRSENAFEPMRLRVVADGAWSNPKAAPVYYPHRDTWYAQPQAQITWWVPLHDVDARDTFVFFPEFFDAPADNDSHLFDYDTWLRKDHTRKIGWQNPNAGREALYPRLRQDISRSARDGFSAKAGQLLLFSGSHLHQTLPNNTGRTRFSLDWRTVHLDDYRNDIGAPKPDNASTGCSLQDYTMPAGVEHPS